MRTAYLVLCVLGTALPHAYLALPFFLFAGEGVLARERAPSSASCSA
jgi:hypothetical protein